MKKANFLYQCKYDPSVIYEYGLQMLDANDEEDFEKLPENAVESDVFREDVLQEYHEHMQAKLLSR